MIGFQGQKAEPVEAPANRLNLLENQSTGCPCRVEECKKHSLSSNSFLFPVEVHPFPVEVRSTSGQGNSNLPKH